MDYGLDKGKFFIFYNVVYFYYIKKEIISVLSINAYCWSWFDANDLCRSNGTTIVATYKSNTYFWTKYYQRRSHWMATLGNHN